MKIKYLTFFITSLWCLESIGLASDLTLDKCKKDCEKTQSTCVDTCSSSFEKKECKHFCSRSISFCNSSCKEIVKSPIPQDVCSKVSDEGWDQCKKWCDQEVGRKKNICISTCNSLEDFQTYCNE